MFIIDDVEQHAPEGYLTILELRVVDNEKLPKHTSRRGDVDLVKLIKLMRSKTNATLRDTKRIVESVLNMAHDNPIRIRLIMGMASIGGLILAMREYGIDVKNYMTQSPNEQERREVLLTMIPGMEQRQDSTTNQLEDLILVAHKIGMYDAADVIKTLLENK